MAFDINATTMACPWGRGVRPLSELPPSEKDKLYAVWKIGQKNLNIGIWCAKNDFSRSTVYSWRKTIQNGGMLHGQAGRPLLVDEKALSEVSNFVAEGRLNGQAPDQDTVKALLFKKVDETAARRGQVHLGTACDRSLSTYMSIGDLRTKSAQDKSDARLEAENDVSTAVSSILMWKYVLEYVKNPNKIINFDATQFSIGPANAAKTKVVVSVKNEADPHNAGRPLSSNKTSSDLNYFIKYFCICTLSGLLCSTFVFVLADSRMGDEELYWYKVPGLTNSSSEDGFGYVVFTKTRCANAAFFAWFVEHVLVPFIKRLDEKYSSTGSDAGFVCCDGEAKQIHPLMKGAIKAMLDALFMMIGKLGASITAIGQPCDAYKMFSSSKACVKAVSTEDVQNHPMLTKNLQTMMQEHETATKQYGKGFDSADKRRLLVGLVKCVIGITKALSPTIIRNSFKKIGIMTDCSFNVSQVLKQFNIKPTANEFHDLMDKLPYGVRKFRETGHITDKQLLKKYLIVRNRCVDIKVPRDQQILSHQRCVMLTHTATVERFDGVVEAKAAAEALKEARKLVREANKEKKATKPAQAVVAKALPLKRKITKQPRRLCICHAEEDSSDAFDTAMVCCTSTDMCLGGEWYHHACLNIEEDDPVLLGDWYCPPCTRNRRLLGVTASSSSSSAGPNNSVNIPYVA